MQLTNTQKPQSVQRTISMVSRMLTNPDRLEAQDILDGLQQYLRNEKPFKGQNNTLRTLVASAEEAIEDIIIAEDIGLPTN